MIEAHYPYQGIGSGSWFFCVEFDLPMTRVACGNRIVHARNLDALGRKTRARKRAAANGLPPCVSRTGAFSLAPRISQQSDWALRDSRTQVLAARFDYSPNARKRKGTDMSARFIMSVAAVGSMGGLVSPALAQETPVYAIQRLGFFGSEYTASYGYEYSEVTHRSADGGVAGISARFDGDASLGYDAWIWHGFGSIQVGLTDAAHTYQGYRQTEVRALNADGSAAGVSRNFTAEGSIGQSAWIWDGSTTRRIGLVGGAYAQSDGSQFSEVQFFNASGQAAGFSTRDADAGGGADAWVWDGTSTRQIGLTGGYRSSRVASQNNVGFVAGVSELQQTQSAPYGSQDAWAWDGTSTVLIGLRGGVYALNNEHRSEVRDLGAACSVVAGHSLRSEQRDITEVLQNGQDAWIWNGSETVQVGLLGGEYSYSHPGIHVLGKQYSEITLGNSNGQVAGWSERYNREQFGGTYLGQDAWVWNGQRTTRIGLQGSVYEDAEGARFSKAELMNDLGHVAGLSKRGGATGDKGQDAWIWNGSTTNQVGLVGGAYLRSDGWQYTETTLLNAAGDAAGWSARYGDGGGRHAWLWNGESTRQVGLTGADYTMSSGFQYSEVTLLNESGQAAGFSLRYDADSQSNGRVAWYYDSVSDMNYEMLLSSRSSDNYAFSRATLLTNGGFLLGNYAFFADGLDEGELRAFIFRPDIGLTDLGSLVNGGLTASGWSTLENPVYAQALDAIIGYGSVNGPAFGQSVFLMTPTSVPAPGAALALGLAGLISGRRRR